MFFATQLNAPDTLVANFKKRPAGTATTTPFACIAGATTDKRSETNNVFVNKVFIIIDTLAATNLRLVFKLKVRQKGYRINFCQKWYARQDSNLRPTD